MSKPTAGQCKFQLPYSKMKKFDQYYLFNLNEDYHELYDKKNDEPERFESMKNQLSSFLASIKNSQVNETRCASSPPSPSPPPSPSSACQFIQGVGLNASDFRHFHYKSKEECCGACIADKACTASCFDGKMCHVKHGKTAPPIVHGRGNDSFVCIPSK